MSHSVRNLSVAAYAMGTTMWIYTSPDSRREIEGSSYWHGAPDTMKPGDWLFVTHTAATGNSIYAMVRQPDGALRARRLASTFAEE